ncbi:hypothetical protein LZ31DRAFT_223505 [Colletotrichum somersetense]|nr:hypothetical protein LZ31DRAFT_223505 [Colletotrichum somersetense]
MKLVQASALKLSASVISTTAVPRNVKRDAQFNVGQPIDANGKGGPILGGTNNQIDRDNPDNLVKIIEQLKKEEQGPGQSLVW